MEKPGVLPLLAFAWALCFSACYTGDRQACHEDNREALEKARAVAAICTSYTEQVTINGEVRERFTLCGASLLALATFGIENCDANADWWFFTP